jgi:transcriptional regulator with XRE-family HTH domain
MTLKQVEEACGLSATHLSEIERGRTSPTIGALARIARALRRDMSFFVEADERAEVSFTSRESLAPAPAGPGATLQAMTTGVPGSQIHAYRVVLESASASFQLPAREQGADALYLVCHGEVDVDMGRSTFRLGPGDALQASCGVPHRLRAVEGAGAECIAVLTCPFEGGTEPPAD